MDNYVEVLLSYSLFISSVYEMYIHVVVQWALELEALQICIS